MLSSNAAQLGYAVYLLPDRYQNHMACYAIIADYYKGGKIIFVEPQTDVIIYGSYLLRD